jgi:AraC family transcriptional regulator
VPTDTIAETIAKRFRLERPPTLFAQQKAIAPIAFTRLRNEGRFHGRTLAVPPEAAFSFQVAVAPAPPAEIWIDGKHGRLGAASPGDTFLFDLTTNPIAHSRPPYDFVRFYLPVATLDQLAHDRGMRCVGGLRTASLGVQDPVMQGLALALLPMLQEPSAGTALFLDAIAIAFHSHVLHKYGGVLGGGSAASAGLTPWQFRRAQAFIEAHLDGDPSISELAEECRLSASHFARAFRQSTGLPPHRWLMKRRIERAKELLLEGNLELVQIALACGFVDQSHFTRIFGQSEGHSPGKWRRLRCN